MAQINSHSLRSALYTHRFYNSCCFYLTLRGFPCLYRSTSRSKRADFEWSIYTCVEITRPHASLFLCLEGWEPA